MASIGTAKCSNRYVLAHFRKRVFWASWGVLLMLLFCANSVATAQMQVGKDIPFRWYEDTSGKMGIEQFTELPRQSLKERDSILSLGYTRSALWATFSLPQNLFQGGDLWLQLGPGFLDEITLYFRPSHESGAWSVRRAGDTRPDAGGDINYRFPVFVLSEPTSEQGYDVVIRASSTSAVLLSASLWSPSTFLNQASRSSAFWGFYFGLAALSSLLALVAAFYLRRRLVWALCAFSLSYGLVACVQGFIGWILGSSLLHWQHYLTSVLTLLTYTSLLWLTTEALELRRRHPRLNQLMMFAIGLNLFLLLSIPFDFYALAIDLQGFVFIVTALILAASAWTIWRDEQSGVMTLMLGLMPSLYVGAGLLALASLFGWIPYQAHVYGIWQYVVMANMLTVLGWMAFQIRQEAREAQGRKQLARALDIEREASFHQRQFIGMVSHEFRNPLAVISNALENLQLKSISDVQRRRRYRNMRLATNRLVQLTDNCLADSRLNTEGLKLQLTQVNVLDLLRSAAEVVDRSEMHRWHLTVDGKSGFDAQQLDISMIVDAAMLRIALSNLLDNAVKYSDQGRVDITVSSQDEPLVIRICDCGAGIASEDAAVIFERYRRRSASEPSKHDPGGTGLGLYVARQIVRAHGGELILASSSAQGSCFELSLPYASKGEAL